MEKRHFESETSQFAVSRVKSNQVARSGAGWVTRVDCMNSEAKRSESINEIVMQHDQLNAFMWRINRLIHFFVTDLQLRLPL